jgi:hypothetical protein
VPRLSLCVGEEIEVQLRQVFFEDKPAFQHHPQAMLHLTLFFEGFRRAPMIRPIVRNYNGKSVPREVGQIRIVVMFCK